MNWLEKGYEERFILECCFGQASILSVRTSASKTFCAASASLKQTM
jgi:hypothetical protein